MSERRLSDLGLWAHDEFEETVRNTIAVGVDSGLPGYVRFISGVAKIIRRRIAEVGEKNDPSRPAVFLLDPKARTPRPDFDPKRVPMLDNGLTQISGRLWFVSPVVVAGKFVELDDFDDDELFQIVTDQLKLGDVPAVIFDPRTKASEIRFYQNGLGDPEACETSTLSDCNVTLEGVIERIDHIYKNGLVTPDAQQRAGKLWKDSMRCYPMNDAEYVVQLYIWAGLAGGFPMCTVRSEQDNVSGRLDLEIEESDPIDRSNFVRHVILELKVLRSYWGSGTVVSEKYTLDWVESGVKQAASYRDERGAREAALCCFDMRTENTREDCFSHVVDLAEDHQVVLKVWFIYATSEKYRDAKIGSTKL